MNFKKKRSFRKLLRASLVILIFFAVPLWVFVIGMITGHPVVWICLLVYASISYLLSWRIEEWVM